MYDKELRTFEEKDASGSIDTWSLGNLHFLFIHGCPVDERVSRATYLHEEKIRLSRSPDPGVPGSAGAPGFTSPPYAACAAFYGDRKGAAELFRNAWKSYWLEPFGMIREYQSQSRGSYVTSFGSLLQSTLLGFTGLRISEGSLQKRRATLPAGWERIEVDRIWVKGVPMKLTVAHGRKARLTQ